MEGDLVVAGGRVEVGEQATIGRDVRIAAGEITIFGTLMDNAQISGGQITLGPDAQIMGNLTYTSPTEIDTSAVQGTAVWIEPPEFNVISYLLGKLISILMLMVTGLVMLLIAGRYTESVSKNITESYWLSLGLGLLALIAVPIVSVILMITVIGLPLGIILLMGYGISIFLSFVLVSYVLGKLFFQNVSTRYVSAYVHMIAGVVFFVVLTSIPIIGGIITFLSLLFGLGGIILLSRSTGRTKRKRKRV